MTDGRSDNDSGTRGVPRHIAIVMDGNGRWAKARMMPRYAGHRAGVESVRRVIEQCGRLGVEVLTLFAFSSENWQRPDEEVSVLMELFLRTLERESSRLHEHNVRIRLIGEREKLGARLREQVEAVEALTADNDGLTLVIAASFGGRWDLTSACRRIAAEAAAGRLDPEAIDEKTVGGHLSLAGLPEPDLLIRTGGEQRISNFLLWHLAYAELYFSPVLWPDFGAEQLLEAVDSYRGRERRYGRTAEQLEAAGRA